MKKVYFLATFMIIAGIANAQTKSSGEVKFGAKAGLNLSNIIKSGDDDFKTEFKSGVHAGLFLEIPLISTLSFAPEIMYSQKGYKTTGNSLLGGPFEYKVTSNFIDIPILAKISPADRFSIYVGPQVSFLTSVTEDFTQGSDTFRKTIKEENNDLRKSLFGGVVGIGIDLTSKLSLNGRYAIDFQKNNGDGTSETPLYKNQVIQAGLGIKF